MDNDFDRFFKSFTNVTPEGDQIERIEVLRTSYKDLLGDICRLVERSPERTIALRNLEDSLMYAVKAIILEG